MALGLSQTHRQRILIPTIVAVCAGDVAECSDVGHQGVHALCPEHFVSRDLRKFRKLCLTEVTALLCRSQTARQRILIPQTW